MHTGPDKRVPRNVHLPTMTPDLRYGHENWIRMMMMIIAKRVVSDMHTTFNSCLIERGWAESGGGRSLLREAIRAAEWMGNEMAAKVFS